MSNGFAMAISIATLYGAIMVLFHVPGVAPAPEVLSCDRKGGTWSRIERVCHLPHNPLGTIAH